MMKPSNILHKQSRLIQMIRYSFPIDLALILMQQNMHKHCMMLKCVLSINIYLCRLKSDWSRGYQRKGTALFYMNRLD
jgi:hypothetical protein